jgi:hypothetical protein
MRIKRLLIDGKASELPHPFIEEVEFLVLKNHELVLENIERLEKAEFSRLCSEMPNSPELDSELAYARSMADDLRNAANQLALVSWSLDSSIQSMSLSKTLAEIMKAQGWYRISNF